MTSMSNAEPKTIPGRRSWARRLTVAGLAALAFIGATALAPTGSTALAVVSHHQVVLSSSECGALVAQAKGSVGAKGMTAHDRVVIKGLTARDCTVRYTDKTMKNVSSSMLTRLGLAPSAASAATNCQGQWKTMGLYIGGWQAVTAHINVGMCWSTAGSTWKNWGPDCYVATNPGMGADVNWCGVYNNGGRYAEPGMNFDIFGYGTPWWKNYHYMRFDVYSNGYVSGVWGG
jgi:hypothetical protein